MLGKNYNELKSKQANEAKKFEIVEKSTKQNARYALVDVLSIIANKRSLNLVLAKSCDSCR